MLIALAVLAALEAAAPPAVDLRMSGSGNVPVSAAPRTLSDVARERREGRHAVGGFSAVETTIARTPIVLPEFFRDAEETQREPEVVPEPQPGGDVPYVSGWGGWYGGGWGGSPPPRRPHVSHFAGPSSRSAPNAGRGPSSRAGATGISHPAARLSEPAMRGARSRP